MPRLHRLLPGRTKSDSTLELLGLDTNTQCNTQKLVISRLTTRFLVFAQCFSSAVLFSLVQGLTTKQIPNVHFHFICHSKIACGPCLKFACKRSQCDFELFAMFNFLQAFACEPLSRIEGSQLKNNCTKQRDKDGTRYQKET